ncbi:MAG TPA: ABC transporter ATP-binding protein, partial [Solirubrobacterales bacterium]|nr:ABC transporter ATP-binding protein [Solirubrobacterales bacterium]
LAALALAFVVLSFSYRTGARIGEAGELAAGHELRLRVAGRVLAPRGGVGERLAGDLAAVAGHDATKVGSLVSLIGYALAALAGGLVGAVFLLSRSPLLGLVVLAGLPLLLVAVERLGRPLARRVEREQTAAGEAGAVAADLIAGLRPLKGIGGEAAAEARYRAASGRAREASVRAARTEAAYEGGITLLTGVLLAVVALLGGQMAASGEISLGELIAALGLTQYLVGPLSQFGWIGSELSAVRASSRRLAAVLDAPAAVAGGSGAPAASGAPALSLRGVRSEPLAGLEFSVSPGELLGVACADPAEAAALVDLLARERDPAAGAIELDGAPLPSLEPRALREAVLVAEHDAALFEGTLREVVTAADDDGCGVGDGGVGGSGGAAELEEALVAAAADEVVESVPGGLEGEVSARGRSLSGGQRQRLALARALAAHPPVLVLHEPTTAVDAASEAGIAARLPRVRRERTTVLVTTSPALLGVADEVVWLDGGAVVDRGPHRELLARQRRYRELVLA